MYEAKISYLEHKFLSKYPNGFNNEEMIKIRKKHNLNKHTEYIRQVCNKENFRFGISIFDEVVKVVQKSSMVSVFEKMRFRDLMKEFDNMEKRLFLDSVYELIHGDEEEGFMNMAHLLEPYKLAKWPILTVWRAYYYVNDDVFVKPTTVKKILKYFEIEYMKYTPKISYGFYNQYRSFINSLKKYIKEESLYVSNPAFSGFFMMTIES